MSSGRWGLSGRVVPAPNSSHFAQLSLLPSSLVAPYFHYVVADPTALPPGYNIEQSQVRRGSGSPAAGSSTGSSAPPETTHPFSRCLTRDTSRTGDRCTGFERLAQNWTLVGVGASAPRAVTTGCDDCEVLFASTEYSVHLP